MEPLRTFRRWLAVTGNGPEWPSGPSWWAPAPSELEEIDWERLSSRGLWMDVDGALGGWLDMDTTIVSEPLAAESMAPVLPTPTLPAFELELSRRKRPMTDLGCLGLFIPPLLRDRCTRFRWFLQGVRVVYRVARCGWVVGVEVGNSYRGIPMREKER